MESPDREIIQPDLIYEVQPCLEMNNIEEYDKEIVIYKWSHSGKEYMTQNKGVQHIRTKTLF